MFAEDLRSELNKTARAKIGDIEVINLLPSSQQELISRSMVNSLWQVLVVENQTAGMGRQARPWLAGNGQISFSVRGWVDAQTSSIGLLSLLASLCVHDVLTSLGLSQIGLKWPNDVLINYQKISGILISVVKSAQNKFDIVLGIGLNRLRLPLQMNGSVLTAISLSDLLPSPPEQSVLIAGLLNAWFARLPLVLSEQGRVDLVNEWHTHALWIGQQVIVTLHNHSIEGVFCGITSDGRLKLTTSRGEQLFSAGEVQLRPHTQFN